MNVNYFLKISSNIHFLHDNINFIACKTKKVTICKRINYIFYYNLSFLFISLNSFYSKQNYCLEIKWKQFKKKIF